MPKLSLERFRKIKGRVAEIFDLATKFENEEIQVTEEDVEKLESEIKQLIDKTLKESEEQFKNQSENIIQKKCGYQNYRKKNKKAKCL